MPHRFPSAGYPLISYLTRPKQSYLGGFNLGGINASGQVPSLTGNWGIIDLDTPDEVRSKVDYVTGQTWQLIFSDEFNVDGRTFYPGDDPYWEAVDLHYWQTNNKEWYDTSAVTTRNGALEITLSRKKNHNLNFTGGMISTWNKFCFTGGLVEASVMLPGYNNVQGLWPAIWAMGNLGRAGYGASLDGMVRRRVFNRRASLGVPDVHTVAVLLRRVRRWDASQPDPKQPSDRRHCARRERQIPQWCIVVSSRPKIVSLHLLRRVASRSCP